MRGANLRSCTSTANGKRWMLSRPTRTDSHTFSHGGEKVDPRFAPLVAARHAFVIPTFAVLESVCNQKPGQRILDDQDLSPYLLLSDIAQLKNGIVLSRTVGTRRTGPLEDRSDKW
jgi:hypothetical protein